MSPKAVVLVALLWVALPATALDSLTLVEPRSGREVQVVSGEAALHVVLFATWCPPCLAELSELSDLAARWGDRGYRVVLVAVNTRQSPSRLNSFADRRPLPGLLLFDAGGRAQETLGVDSVPAHVLFDRHGNEVHRSGSLDQGLERAIAGLVEVRQR